MNTNYKNKNGGLIKWIILIVIAVLILSWFNVDIKEFFMSEQVQRNFGYIWNFIKDTWSTYLAGPATKLWGIIKELIK
jgi:hypothetical protein